MNNIKHKKETVDKESVQEYVEGLIKEHKGFNPLDISIALQYHEAIHAANVTCKRLAQETAKPFYYECIKYIKELNG